MRKTFRTRKKFWLSAAALACFAAPIAFGQMNAPQNQPSPQTATKLSFEVASVKEWVDGKGPAGVVRVGLQFSGDRVFSLCSSLRSLIFYAYRLTLSVPVTGIPEWGKAGCGGTFQDTFTIDAKIPAGTTDDQTRQMMQTLLADRFKLAVHWETKDMPTFALVIGKGGFKLQPVDPEKVAQSRFQVVSCPAEDPSCHIVGGESSPISALANSLSLYAGRPVIDQTGLTGNYNTDLKWAGDTTTNSPLPSLPAALREKFGLELKPQNGPVDVLVIDHVEKPTPN